MSVAVSAFVKPSPSLFILTVLLCMGPVVASLYFAFGGALSTAGFLFKFALVGAGCGFAFLGFYCAALKRKAYKIDISGVGQIRLTQAKLQPNALGLKKWTLDQERCTVVHFLPHSTLWPWLLLLRLRNEQGQLISLPILLDSVSCDNFRALAVACRWIAAHDNSKDATIRMH